MKPLIVIATLLLWQAPVENKDLKLYGCVTINYPGYSYSWSQVCKIYDPETQRRFMVAIAKSDKGDGISLIEIDHEGPKPLYQGPKHE